MTKAQGNHLGYTLIELVLIIVIFGIVATVAFRQMRGTIESAQYEQTKKEMEQLTCAIAGNPQLVSNNTRTDFGYVGDVGALPPDLDALVSNPGGYSTWNGPYIELPDNGDGYKRDAWGSLYIFTDTLIRSAGSGSDIDRLIAANSQSLLNNTIRGYVVDADNDPPGNIYNDSLLIRMNYPDGSGGSSTAVVYPDANGYFELTNQPIGTRQLIVIYQPDTDTIAFSVTINPNSAGRLSIVFPADLW